MTNTTIQLNEIMKSRFEEKTQFLIRRFIQRSFNVVGSFTCPTKLQRSWSAVGLFALLFIAGLTNSRAQDSWTQKADFGGTGRESSVGFSIGSKGYIGTGEYHDNVNFIVVVFNDFWEFDPSTNAWTQKADFAGVARWFAVGFSIGSKGYIGTGSDSNFNLLKDFWEYDPAANTWTQKADFGAAARYAAVGFSIGSKGYIGTGYDNNFNLLKDFWEYDPTGNAWTQKANVAGVPRSIAVGFSIGSKGYIGTGSTDNGTSADFFEYDPAANTWAGKANFGGTDRAGAAGFSFGGKGYIGTGNGSAGTTNDFWEYDPSTNTWIQKADFGGTARFDAVGFSIGNKGYIGTGNDDVNFKNDLWEYSLVCTGLTVYADADEDEYGDATNSLFVADCIAPAGYVYNSTDCNDANPNVHPNAAETCGNGIDDNCNGVTDEDCVEECTTPTGLAATKITASSAKLKWNAVAGAEGYSVRYKVSNTDVWKYGTTSGTSKPISGLMPNTVYKWQVQTFCHLAPNVTSDWSSKQKFTTGSLRMGDESLQQISFQIYPNPAEDHTTIQFSLPQSSHVYIKVYDVNGKEIATLLDDTIEQGEYSVLLTTNKFSKGVYMVRMISDFGIENQKLIVQ